MKKSILFLVFFILLSSFIYAVPPVQTTVSSTGNALEIVYPKGTAYKQNTTFKLHFHIYNITGTAVPSSQIRFCTIHIYNTSNSHIYQKNLSLDSNGVEYAVTLNNTFSKSAGFYPYLVWCDGTLADGYLSTVYIVTKSGDVYDNASPALLLIILLPLLFGLVLLYASFKLDAEFWTLQLTSFLLFPFMVLSSFHFGFLYLQEFYPMFTDFQNNIGKTTYIIGMIIFILFSYFAIWIIKKGFLYIQEKNKEDMGE